jgi:hypothetical protein
VAAVEVESVRVEPKKGGLQSWMRLGGKPRFIADGVTIRLEKAELWALSQIPAKLREKTSGSNLQMANVRLFAPGEIVPRLIARQVEVNSAGVWTLRKVLLEGRPSIAACTLSFHRKADPQLRTHVGQQLSLRGLLFRASDP